MITDGVAEILVGVIVDPQFGQVLVLGAGGVLTELLPTASRCCRPGPRSRSRRRSRAQSRALLGGFRGKPAGDVAALVEAVHGGRALRRGHLRALSELDVNPIIVRPLGQGRGRRRCTDSPQGEMNPCPMESLTVKDGAILEVTIDRPKANAIDLAASRRLNDVFRRFATIRRCASRSSPAPASEVLLPGWDLKAAAAGEKSDEDWGVGGFGGLNYPRNLNKPIIAAVNGIACGGGFEIVLGTDIIVMEEHAKFALPEINVGVLADAGTIKLPRRMPYHVAVEFLLTGRWMDAAEAKHWGLANHVVPKGTGAEQSPRDRAQLADGPPLLFPAIKQLIAKRKWSRSIRRSNCTTRSMPCSA
jgi:crotonobetainyl-CoA hydratase